MKRVCVCLVIAFIALQTPVWALRSSGYRSTLKSNKELNQESSAQWNDDLKKESAFKDNDELNEQESSYVENKGLNKEKSSVQENRELKEGSAVKTGNYDTPIVKDGE